MPHAGPAPEITAPDGVHTGPATVDAVEGKRPSYDPLTLIPRSLLRTPSSENTLKVTYVQPSRTPR